MTEDHIRKICKIGQGVECCRYLGAGAKGFICLRNTDLREVIDKQKHTMNAQGDNCEGV